MKNLAAGAKRILLVEDEPAISQVCRRVLASEGFEMDTAVNGIEAEGRLQERDYDLIIIDIRTPVMNGKELYQYIKEEYPRLVERVIFTTGDVLAGETRSFLEQRGRPLLLKPFTPDNLKAIVKETLRQIEK